MKNKLNYILLSLLLCFSCINIVYADEFNVIVGATASKNSVSKGEEVTIKLNVKSNSLVDNCAFEVESDSTLEYISMNAINGSGWSKTMGTVNKFIMESDTSSTTSLVNGVDILELKYKVNDSGKLIIKTSQCAVAHSSTESDSDTDIDSVEVQINVSDSGSSGGSSSGTTQDTSLSGITVRGGKLAPTFNSQIYIYTILLDSPNFGLTLTATNSEYQDDIVVKGPDGNTISDWNNITWSDSSDQAQMPIDIVVAGKTTYNLLFIYQVEGLDSSLSSLSIDGKNILEEGKNDYVYEVDKNAKSFKLDATIKDSDNFHFSESSHLPGVFSIGDGTADILIEVKAKDPSIGATSSTYTIVVKKKNSTSNDDGNTSSNGTSNNNATSNPGTGGISTFIMAIILVSSFVCSIILYQKNLEGYK